MMQLCPFCSGISCWSLEEEDGPGVAVMQSPRDKEWYLWWTDGETNEDGITTWTTMGVPIHCCPNCGSRLENRNEVVGV